jgi:predicted DCC family thiol-disulfide oxidoreductase YuxK
MDDGQDRATLLYDGTCPLCISAAEWVSRKAFGGTIETLPCQDRQRAVRFPQVTEAACAEAMQLVVPDGTVYSGEQAFPHLLPLLRGWRWLAWIFSVPGVSRVMPYAYRWIARHRYALSAVLGHSCEDAREPCKKA